MAIEFHHLAQVRHHLVAPSVVSDLEQAHMKAFVDFEELVGVANSCNQLLVNAVEVSQLSIARLDCHHTCRVRL